MKQKNLNRHLDVRKKICHPLKRLIIKNIMGEIVTRSELVQRVLDLYPNLDSNQAEKSIAVILDEITQALQRGNRVELRGFGVFSPRIRKARVGRNPRTGTSVSVDEKTVPFFKTGKNLHERLNGLAV